MADIPIVAFFHIFFTFLPSIQPSYPYYSNILTGLIVSDHCIHSFRGSTMKIVDKLYLITAFSMILVLSLYGFYSYKSETEQMEMDMRLDAHVLANALSPILSEIWDTSGQERVLEYINDANKQESLIHVKLADLNPGKHSRFTPCVPIEKLKPVLQGNELMLWAEYEGEVPNLYTYLPLKHKGENWALELSESRNVIISETRRTVTHLILMGVLLLTVAAFFIRILGHEVVGRRMGKLVNYAHEIGKGDLSENHRFPGNDEITLLGNEMNAMCRNLIDARINLIKENNAKMDILEQLRHTERLATVGRLSSGVAHELGTPLNVVLGRARSIQAGDLPPETIDRYSTIIISQTERMIKIIRQLLDFARRKKPDRAPCPIQPLLKQIVEILEPMAGKRNVGFDLAENPDSVIISIDESQIQQVLVNIIINGIQSMIGGGTLHISTSVLNRCFPDTPDADEQQYLRVLIRDEGSGISADIIDSIFDPFFTTKNIGDGTGLGLSIAYGIMKDHEGWIEVESTEGSGSSFSVYFPLGHSNARQHIDN